MESIQSAQEITTDAALLRPRGISPISVASLALLVDGQIPRVPDSVDCDQMMITGVAIDSRSIQPGDLYIALPGARTHGAEFAQIACKAGAIAVLTDSAGAEIILHSPEESFILLVVVDDPRSVVGEVSRHVYQSQGQGETDLSLFAVTGTNGKTTTTYFVNSMLRSLGHETGLIGTIEILAGDQRIPSKLTTPEAPTTHALLSVMRESGMTAASMEVSSHAIEFHRTDGIRYDVAGFTNLTQDHLDLHGSMQEYFEVKAQLFTPDRARRAVVVVTDSQDQWGVAMAAHARCELGPENVDVVMTRALKQDAAQDPALDPDWQVEQLTRDGIGHSFQLVHRDGRSVSVRTGLPGEFNVENAALAVVMILASGVDLDLLQRVLGQHDPLTTDVPGRMQLIGSNPTAVVDFAHNPDALARALAAVDPPTAEGKVIVVFGATGERDKGKRPLMGRIAAQGADVVIISDDDPHGEDPAAIRHEVIAGARQIMDLGQARAQQIQEIVPRAAAIKAAVDLAGPHDSIIVAGRGHETVQEIAGVDHPLDDRVELRTALEQLSPQMQEDRGESQ